MGVPNDVTLTSTIERLEAARSPAPAIETEQALARLESALFGAPQRNPALDRYPLIERLGQGGSGTVYLAYDPRLDRKVAIKLLDVAAQDEEGRADARARLLREAQAMARSPHPNIVAVYDVGTYDNARDGEPGVFLVMEYVQGPDLQTWLAKEPPWKEVLEVFVEAGRGLAAAHRVGVTHRDFKPANAILGPDTEKKGSKYGRVRVLDFGLARGAGQSELDRTPVRSHTSSAAAVLDEALTEEGAVLGTPAFMAPEQHLGLPADATSDQFSFCVSLWLGLYRRRPYEGRSVLELGDNKLRGPPAIPEATDVPNWLGEVLARGMAADPAARWPSMDALLDALTRRIARARRRRRIGVAAFVLVALGLGGWILAGTSEPPCTGAAKRLDGIWNDARASEIQAAFEGSGAPAAPSGYARIEVRVDRFAEGWTEQYVQACEATAVRGDQSPELMDLRMACLDRQKRDLDALLVVLSEADAQTVEHAAEVSGRIPRPQQCGDTERLLASVEPPSDPTVEAAVQAQRTELARVRALVSAGRIPEALELAKTVTQRAEGLGYDPLLAEALVERGEAEDRAGHYDDAVETLATAHAVALASGHDRHAAKASQLLVFVYGERKARLDAALQWAQIAGAEIDRAGLDEDRAALLSALASAYRIAGDFETSKQHSLQVLELLRREPEPDALAQASQHLNVGDTLRELGELDEAQEHLQTARDTFEDAFGPAHPMVANALNNLGTVALAKRDFTRAEAHLRRAVEIREQTLGPDHPKVATALANLAVVYRRQERYDDAREALAHALEILRGRLGSDDPMVAQMLASRGSIEAADGDHEAAVAHFDGALVVLEAALPPDHPSVGSVLKNRAISQAHLGQHAAAEAGFARSLAIKQKAYGASDPQLAEAKMSIARTWESVGAWERATRVAAEALQHLDPAAAPALTQEIETWLAEARERYAGVGGSGQRTGL